MEEICSFPQIPDFYYREKYFCVVGSKDSVLKFLFKDLEISVNDLKTGIVFYRFKDVLVVCYVNDKDDSFKRISYLAFLTEIFENIVYLLDSRAKLISSNSKIGVMNHEISKLRISTFYHFLPEKNKYLSAKGEKIELKKKAEVLNVSAFSNFSVSELDYRSFKKIYLEFSEFFRDSEDFEDRARLIEERTKVLSDNLVRIGIPKATFDTMKGIVNVFEKKMQEKILEFKLEFYEKVMELLLSSNGNSTNPFRVKQTITKKIVFNMHFNEFIELFDNKLKSVTIVDLNDMMKFFEKNLFAFFINNSGSTREQFKQQISNLIYLLEGKKNESIKLLSIELVETIKKLGNDRGNREINVMIKKQMLSNPFEIFEQATFYFDYDIELIQILNCGSCYLFTFKSLKSYFIFKYKDENHYELIKEYQEKPIMAYGCNYKKIIITQNSIGLIEVISCDHYETHTALYENNEEINYPNYVVKFDCLIFIDDKNQAKNYNLRLKVVTNLNIKEKVFAMRISDNQEFVGVCVEKFVRVLDLKMQTVFQIESTCVNFYISITEEKSFVLYFYEGNSLKIETFTRDKEASTFYPEIMDISEEICHIFSVPLNDTRNFYIQSDLQEDLEFAYKFFKDLQELSKTHQIQKYSKPLLSTPSFLPELSPKFSFKLKNLRYTAIADISNSNLIPKFKNPSSLLPAIKNSKQDLFSLILSLSDFQELEALISKFPKLKVISIIGDKNWFKHFNSIFNKDYLINYNSSVWANINEINEEFYLCLYSPFVNDLIELQKLMSFFYAVSHHFLVCPPENFNFLNLFKCLKLAQTRFPEISAEPDSIQILIMKKIKDLLTLDGFSISYFTEPRLLDEMRYLIESFALNKQAKDSKELMRIIKGVLISLYLDDDVAIFDRLNGKANDVELMKTFTSKDDSFYLESFQINKNPQSGRCKSICPGCSAMCELPSEHKSAHQTRVHRKYKNRYSLDMEDMVDTTCELRCHENSHYHYEPCVGACKSEDESFKTKWKHRDQGKAFDITNIEYTHDKIECKTWWNYNEWSLSTIDLN